MYVPDYSETYFTTKLWNVVIYSLELKNLISDFWSKEDKKLIVITKIKTGNLIWDLVNEKNYGVGRKGCGRQGAQTSRLLRTKYKAAQWSPCWFLVSMIKISMTKQKAEVLKNHAAHAETNGRIKNYDKSCAQNCCFATRYRTMFVHLLSNSK
jgi:hypothetical protein